MALSCLMRGAGSKVNVSPLLLLTKQTAKFCTGPVSSVRGSPLFTILARSHIERKPVSSGFAQLQIKQVQKFSVSPKSYSSAGEKHNHHNLWRLERLISLVLLGLIPAALITPNQIFDLATAVLLVMHCHWGVEASVVDYIRPKIFGPVIPKVAMGLVYVLSILALTGFCNLIYNDIGLANTVKKIWQGNKN